MITFVCVKVGSKYGPEYVNRLRRMIKVNYEGEHKFICLTDDRAGLTTAWTPVGTDLPGWWAKLILFKPHPALVGRVIYMDLDTVIAGNIDWLADYRGLFCILRDFYQPTGWGSAIMSFQAGCHPEVWSHHTIQAIEHFTGDQDWIKAHIGKADIWQDLFPGKIGSYKADKLQDGPGKFSIVCFHGEPRPHEVGGWVTDVWH